MLDERTPDAKAERVSLGHPLEPRFTPPRKVEDRENTDTEARFRAMFEQASVGIVQIGEDGLFIAANPGFCEFVGYSCEELQRMRVRDVTHPEDYAREEELTRQLRAGEIFEYTLEKRYVAKDGRILWGSMTATVVRGSSGESLYTLAIVQAIGDRKRAEEELRTSEERFRLLVEGARDYAMFLLDSGNKITYWNTGAERVFGWSAEEAVGQSGDIIFIPEDKTTGSVERELSIAIEQGYAPDRRWHLRKDGSRFWADGVMRRIDHKDGSLRGFAKIARDASDMRRKEDELTRAHDELEQRVHDRTKELQSMNETLEQEMMQRQKLERQILEVTEHERARISQDLHDSLCQELTATAFLLKSRAKSLGATDPEASEALTEGAQMVNRNAGLARDLARGLHPLELGSGGLVSALRELASRTSQTVTCRCECPRSLRVPNDNVAVNLYRIAQEAVTNALKHAKPNEIIICIAREHNDVVLSVQDDGKPKRKAKGTGGLGIQMMQYRASVSGGSLTVERKGTKGTMVTCRVPLKV